MPPEKSKLWTALNALAVGAGISIGAADAVVQAATPEERNAYEAATTAGTIDSLQEFLILFPESELAPRVFEQLNAKIVTPAPEVAPRPAIAYDPQLALSLFDEGGPTTSIY